MLGCEQEEVKGCVTNLQGQTGPRSVVSAETTPEPAVELEIVGKLEMACLRPHALEASCLGNAVAFQGRRKRKKTVKKLLSTHKNLEST